MANNGVNGQLTEKQRESELIRLKNSYDMYENTKSETVDMRKNKTDKNGNHIYSEASIENTMELIETAQDDIREQYLALGGKLEDLLAKKRGKKTFNRQKLSEMIKYDSENRGDGVDDGVVHKTDTETARIIREGIRAVKKENTEPINEEEVVLPLQSNTTFNAPEKNDTNIYENNVSSFKKEEYISGKDSFDTIPIPSGGVCYKHKLKKIPVAYLTAYDENLMVSPNLYQDGTFLDFLLKSKIKSSAVNPEELLPGDRDAIILWLRATGYGPDYPITVNDKETGTQFETTFNLNEIKYKTFKLNADENGYFDYTLPRSKDKIKFKFLSYKEINTLGEIEENENKKILRRKIGDYAEVLTEVLENDNDIERPIKLKMTGAINTIKEYADTFSEKDTALFSHSVTNRLAMSIVSVNGMSDRNYINDYVMNMNVMDSSALRKYITENEPGLDFNIKVERPESLGGGSIETFLELNQYLFLNI